MRFIIGTTNKYKIRELAAILQPLGIPLDVTDPIDPEETGETMRDNARIKVQAYGRYVGIKSIHELVGERGCSHDDARTFLRMAQTWVISEDSGLIVPVLHGLPGPWSARFDDCLFEAGRLTSYRKSDRGRDEIDVANNRRVLELMQEIEQPHRAAAFEICLMVGDIDGNVMFESTARTNGWILPEITGTGGFGYDPIFVSDTSFGKSWAQIDLMRKNLISHRRKVLQDFTTWLASQIRSRRH